MDDNILVLIQSLFPHARLRHAWTLSGGISAGMTALEIELPTGGKRKIILRRPGKETLHHHPSAAEEEYKVLQVAHALGVAAPEALFYGPSGQVFPTPYLVIDYVEGKPDFAPANKHDYAHKVAEHLARIHRADISRFDLSFLPPQPKGTARIVTDPPSQLNRSMDEARIREALQTAWPVPRRNAPALLHGDYWPGNLLWQAGRLAAVIDWEDAALGDPLADLAISRLDFLWILGREAMQSFTEHYLSIHPIDSTHLPAWDLVAALRLVRMAGADLKKWAEFFHPYGRTDITEETIREQYHFFVEQAFDKLKD